jgi:hypothetical protein
MTAGARLVELEVYLEIEPKFCFDAEGIREVERGFCGDAFLSAYNFAHQLFRPPDRFGKRSLRQTTRLELLSKNFAWYRPDDGHACEFSRFHQ